MAPRWFKNVKFGQDLTNQPHREIIENFRQNFAKELQDFTFSSTGPIIQEVESEDESDQPVIEELAHKSSEIEASPDESAEIEASPEESSEIEVSAHELSDIVEPAGEESEIDESAEEPIEIEAPADELSAIEEPVDEPIEVEASTKKTPVKEASRNEPPATKTPTHEQPVGILPLRRSSRQKWKPLDHARGQRISYNLRGDVIKFEEGFPAKYDYSRARKSKVSLKRVKTHPNATNAPPISYKDAKKGDYKFSSRQIGSRIVGHISLEPSQKKPEAKTDPTQVYSFLVRRGEIIIKMIDHKSSKSIYADSSSDWVELERGKRYSIKNCGTTKATVVYLVEDRNQL